MPVFESWRGSTPPDTPRLFGRQDGRDVPVRSLSTPHLAPMQRSPSTPVFGSTSRRLSGAVTPLHEYHLHRERQPCATKEMQWALSLRSARPSTSSQMLTMRQSSSDLNSRSPSRGSLSHTSTLHALPKIPPPYMIPRRTFTFGGNEAGNPSFYPLPFGKMQYSTRCG